MMSNDKTPVSKLSIENASSLSEKIKHFSAQVNAEDLNSEQRALYNVFNGSEKFQSIRSEDIDSLRELLVVTRGASPDARTPGYGAHKILYKHYGDGAGRRGLCARDSYYG